MFVIVYKSPSPYYILLITSGRKWKVQEKHVSVSLKICKDLKIKNKKQNKTKEEIGCLEEASRRCWS